MQIIGIVAGVIGGWIIGQIVGPGMTADKVTATTIGAVLASRLVTDVYRLAKGGASAQG